MRGLGTDHVISGPMRGLKKNRVRWRKHTDRHTDGHGDSMTESAQWGRFSENTTVILNYYNTASISLTYWKSSKRYSTG